MFEMKTLYFSYVTERAIRQTKSPGVPTSKSPLQAHYNQGKKRGGSLRRTDMKNGKIYQATRNGNSLPRRADSEKMDWFHQTRVTGECMWKGTKLKGTHVCVLKR